MCFFRSKIAIHESHTLLLTPIVMKLSFKSNMRPCALILTQIDDLIRSFQPKIASKSVPQLPAVYGPATRSRVDAKHGIVDTQRWCATATEYDKGGWRGAEPPLGVRTNHLRGNLNLVLCYLADPKIHRKKNLFFSGGPL